VFGMGDKMRYFVDAAIMVTVPVAMIFGAVWLLAKALLWVVGL
jgi:hypothetical protein